MTVSLHCVAERNAGWLGKRSLPLRASGCAAALFTIAAFAPTPAAAQDEYDAHGAVADSSGGGLPNAMVVALSRGDSVLIKYSLTNQEGNFRLEGLPAGEYILQVTHIGYETIRRDFDVIDADVSAGQVQMVVQTLEVDELVVSIEHVPFINRRDTLSYNAAAFETPPNATAEDLLRRLPGIQVADDGSITAQGEDVENVLVDGKEFFSGDPTVATRNLAADAVKQVDVYDKQSDMAEFTGIADGDDERTIDLLLREEARVGYFGRGSGAFGSDVNNQARLGGSVANDARYDGALNVNRFSPTGQYALIANANNVSQAGFSAGGGGAEYVVSEGRGGGGGGGDGFTETVSLGVNANRDFGGNNWIRSSYFYGGMSNLRNATVQQQALFSSNMASLVDETSSRDTNNQNHRLNLNSQVAFSPAHQLRARVNAYLRDSETSSASRQETHNPAGGSLNSATTDNQTIADNVGGDVQVTWRKRLDESGRSVVAELRSDIQESDQTTDLFSRVTGGGRGGNGTITTNETLQEQNREGRTWNNSVRLSLTQPLWSDYVAEVFGQRNATSEDRDNPVYDIVNDVPVFNKERSTGFERAYNYYLGGLRFSRNGERSWITLGLQAQRSDLEGVIQDRSGSITNGYTHLLPKVEFKVEVKDGHNVSFRYNTSSREPSLTQLQPFVDNTNPLNVYAGNPNLEPEYTHGVRTDYRFFDQFSFVNLFTYAGFTYTDNAIAQSRLFDERGIQTRSPINTEGAWSGNVGANFGTPIRRLGVDLDLEYRLTYSEGTELVNLVPNDNRSVRNTLQFGIDNRVKQLFDLRVGAEFNFNSARYSLNDELNRDYLNSSYFLNGTLYASSGWTIHSTMSYVAYGEGLYGSNDPHFGQPDNIARWDAAIMRRVLDDRAEIELRAFDLLNQNQGVNISNNSNFIQESRTESLGQHFMLSVMYRLGPRFVRGGRVAGRRG